MSRRRSKTSLPACLYSFASVAASPSSSDTHRQCQDDRELSKRLMGGQIGKPVIDFLHFLTTYYRTIGCPSPLVTHHRQRQDEDPRRLHLLTPSTASRRRLLPVTIDNVKTRPSLRRVLHLLIPTSKTQDTDTRPQQALHRR